MAPQDSQICGGNFPKRKKIASRLVPYIIFHNGWATTNKGCHLANTIDLIRENLTLG